MEKNKRAGLFIDDELMQQVAQEIEVINRIAYTEYAQALQKGEVKSQRKVPKPKKLTVKSYSEGALSYFLRNHIDPRTMGQQKDVLTEVQKLRNNVFAFMQVQERQYIMPMTDGVKDIKNTNELLVDNSLDTLNLLEIFIDLMLAGLGLDQQEQDQLRQIAAEKFSRKKALRQPANDNEGIATAEK